MKSALGEGTEILIRLPLDFQGKSERPVKKKAEGK